MSLFRLGIITAALERRSLQSTLGGQKQALNQIPDGSPESNWTCVRALWKHALCITNVTRDLSHGKFKSGESVKLTIKISSDANVGSNVNLDDIVLKKSITNKFSVELGKIDEIDGKTLSVVSNFFVISGAIDAIIEASHVDCILASDSQSETISAENNAQLGLSGYLYFDGEKFLQYLEGEEEEKWS